MDAGLGLATLRFVFPAATGLTIENWGPHAEALPVDITFSAGGRQFAVEFKAAATSEQIGSAITHARHVPAHGSLPLLVVPYMGDAGRHLCRAARLSWFDLSGNADIDAPPIRIRILGEPNRYKRPGRPETLFAPRSARLARALLQDHPRVWQQTELVRATGLSSGFISRLLPRYMESGYLGRKQKRRTNEYRLTDADGLLDAWWADYNFGHHTILRGHVAARSGAELVHALALELGQNRIGYAATGLASAWLWEPFAAFRLVTLYLAAWPGPELLHRLGFRDGARGSNAWLVVPDDEGVFTGSIDKGGVRCVSSIQTYLDLKAQPERAEEAAAELRRTLFAVPTGEQKRNS